MKAGITFENMGGVVLPIRDDVRSNQMLCFNHVNIFDTNFKRGKTLFHVTCHPFPKSKWNYNFPLCDAHTDTRHHHTLYSNNNTKYYVIIHRCCCCYSYCLFCDQQVFFFQSYPKDKSKVKEAKQTKQYKKIFINKEARGKWYFSFAT